jgi:tetratricopeptide (TPR) repeat protein
VVEDEQELEHEYQNDYRGRVQNRKVEIEFQPLFALSFEPMKSEVRSMVAFDRNIDALNQRMRSRTIYINNVRTTFSEAESKGYFAYIDSLSMVLNTTRNTTQTLQTLFLRAVAFTAIQNYESAIEDLSTYLQEDTTSVAALWQRAYCQSRINQFLTATNGTTELSTAEGTSVELKNANVLADFNHALALCPQNAYLLYNRGNLHAQRKAYESAIADYSAAIAIENNLAEAYFNRGLCLIYSQHVEDGIRDLSKAGELGVLPSYNVLKRMTH